MVGCKRRRQPPLVSPQAETRPQSRLRRKLIEPSGSWSVSCAGSWTLFVRENLNGPDFATTNTGVRCGNSGRCISPEEKHPNWSGGGRLNDDRRQRLTGDCLGYIPFCEVL